MVGFRDQGSAEAFLSWIFPTLLDRGKAAEYDMKLHLARMMVRAAPNNEIADELFLRIGDDIIAKIDAGQLAFLADQMFIMKEQGDHNDELASESEMLAARIIGPPPAVS
ncbi:hypothetical protein SAMN04488144_1596 [Methylobacterium sp. 190mf]|nr:hypothetical protein SAMN04488144_1596 [Methylobacterium sp. 190mf]